MLCWTAAGVVDGGFVAVEKFASSKAQFGMHDQAYLAEVVLLAGAQGRCAFLSAVLQQLPPPLRERAFSRRNGTQSQEMGQTGN